MSGISVVFRRAAQQATDGVGQVTIVMGKKRQMFSTPVYNCIIFVSMGRPTRSRVNRIRLNRIGDFAAPAERKIGCRRVRDKNTVGARGASKRGGPGPSTPRRPDQTFRRRNVLIERAQYNIGETLPEHSAIARE